LRLSRIQGFSGAVFGFSGRFSADFLPFTADKWAGFTLFLPKLRADEREEVSKKRGKRESQKATGRFMPEEKPEREPDLVGEVTPGKRGKPPLRNNGPAHPKSVTRFSSPAAPFFRAKYGTWNRTGRM